MFELDVPYLNPEEAFSVQLLVASKMPEIAIPKPIVRAKGIVGINRITQPHYLPFKVALLVSGSSAILTAVAATLFILLSKRTPKIFYTIKHRDDVAILLRSSLVSMDSTKKLNGRAAPTDAFITGRKRIV